MGLVPDYQDLDPLRIGPDWRNDEPARSRAVSRLLALRKAFAEGGEMPVGDIAEAEVVNVPVVKSDWDKTPRNAACPCGSGKKFKQCHGR